MYPPHHLPFAAPWLIGLLGLCLIFVLGYLVVFYLFYYYNNSRVRYLFFGGFMAGLVGGFSLVSSRALVVPGSGFGGVPLAAPWWRRVAGSGLSAGAVRWRVRLSSRSFSGAVVVVGFSCPSAAAVFAGAWSGWCGLSLAVRRFAGSAGPVWGVSVPVAVSPALALAAPAALPSGRAAWVRG